jgi:hypothetical protein
VQLNLTKKKTVDGILHTFTKGLDALRKLADDEVKEALKEEIEAERLKQSAHSRKNEAQRAVIAIENINKLIPPSSAVVIKDTGIVQ